MNRRSFFVAGGMLGGAVITSLGSMDRDVIAKEVLDDWDGEDLDELDTELEDGLDGITGKALASVALMIGEAFANMMQKSQEDSGVSQYMWHTQSDSHVRPAHAKHLFDSFKEHRGRREASTIAIIMRPLDATGIDFGTFILSTMKAAAGSA